MVWFQGEENITNILFKENVQNWKILNPTWKFHLCDDKILREACKKFSKECLDLYDSFDLMHLKIDLGRYVLLYLYGGIYVDIDAFIIRSLDSSKYINNFIVENDKNDTNSSLGLSTLNLDVVESMIFVGHKKMVNNAIMLSTKYNMFLEKMIIEIIKEKNTFYYSDFNSIQNKTGPIFLNKFLHKYIKYIHKNKILNHYIKFFPSNIFEPCPPFGMVRCYLTEETVCIHSMEMSWISSNLKELIKFYYNFKPFGIVLLIIYPIYSISKNKK